MMNPDHFHPLSVHFPIALLIIGFLFDLVSLFFKKEHCLSKAGFYLMILGTLGAVAAYFTGEYFARSLEGPLSETKEFHELFAKITMWVMIGVSLIRIITVSLKKDKGFLKWIVFILYMGGAGLVGYTGWLGGSLVYDHMLDPETSTASVPVNDSLASMKTYKNLELALQEETVAMEKYVVYAAKAKEEKIDAIALLFDAIAISKKVHLRNLTNAFAKFGGKWTEVKTEVTAKSTLENLMDVLGSEIHISSEFEKYIADADIEKAEDAGISLGYIQEVRTNSLKMIESSLLALETGKTNVLPASYSICPKCGLIYNTVELPDECDLCGTSKSKFTTIP